MNKRIRASYPPEFKERAVELAKTGERSVRQLEVELGLSANLLRQWVQQYDKNGALAWIRRASGDDVKTTSPEAAGVAGSHGNGNGNNSGEGELRLQFEQLQRQYRQLQQDNAILIKALTIFAQESK